MNMPTKIDDEVLPFFVGLGYVEYHCIESISNNYLLDDFDINKSNFATSFPLWIFDDIINNVNLKKIILTMIIKYLIHFT